MSDIVPQTGFEMSLVDMSYGQVLNLSNGAQRNCTLALALWFRHLISAFSDGIL